MKESLFISKLIMLGWFPAMPNSHVLLPNKQFTPGFMIVINTTNKAANFMRIKEPVNKTLYSELLNTYWSYEKILKLVLEYTNEQK